MSRNPELNSCLKSLDLDQLIMWVFLIEPDKIRNILMLIHKLPGVEFLHLEEANV